MLKEAKKEETLPKEIREKALKFFNLIDTDGSRRLTKKKP